MHLRNTSYIDCRLRSADFDKTGVSRFYSQIAHLFIRELSKHELIIRKYVTKNTGGQYKTRVSNLSRNDPVTSFLP